MVSNKTLGYVALVAAGVIGVYVIWKKGLSEGAKSTLSGISGKFGGAAKSMIGESTGDPALMGKAESQAAVQNVAHRMSSMPATQASTKKQAAMTKGGLFTKSAMQKAPGGHIRPTAPVQQVSARTSGAIRAIPGMGRLMSRGKGGGFQKTPTSKPAAAGRIKTPVLTSRKGRPTRTQAAGARAGRAITRGDRRRTSRGHYGRGMM